MVDRGTVDRLFDWVEGLRAARYTPGRDPVADARILPTLASMSDDHGLYDACCAKIIDPQIDRETFALIAGRDPKSLGVLVENANRAWSRSGYDVSDVQRREFCQDVPQLFYEMALRMPDRADRAGVLRVAAYVSFLKGDSDVTVQYHLNHLFECRPSDEMGRNLNVAFRDQIMPAWQVERMAEHHDGHPVDAVRAGARGGRR